MWQKYLFPTSVDEALQMLHEHRGKARIIAGGTDLVLQIQRGRHQAEVLVDITRIPELDGITEQGDYICIGARVTHAQVAASSLIREKAKVLAEACGSIGGPQIRNVATLVGNVVNALPAADGAVALFALDAEVEVADREGRRWFPIADLYEGVGRCRVDPCAQMVTALRFHPLADGLAGAFQRLAQRRALILPMLNTAVVVGVQNGKVYEARIAVGPVAPVPFRARAAEEFLVGRLASEETITEAARLAARDAHPRDSLLRGSSEYRKEMVEVLVRRALIEAVERVRP